MDPRVKILIEGVRKTHTPFWWLGRSKELLRPGDPGAGVADAEDPWCEGCYETLVSQCKCPVLQAANELEAEDDSTESDSD